MKGRVLIAEDEPSLRKCMAAFLEAEKFDVKTVESAALAIAALNSGEFDVVITDMKLETEKAGYEIVRAARAKAYDPEVVVYTSFYIAAAEWKKRGVRKLFTKGDVEISEMTKAVNRILDERVRRRAPLPTGVNETAEVDGGYQH
ncbi:MAG TPA: response regulator [Terriglobales bacterium]|nr:response regulator [Terriglobales bacterium]